MSENQSNDLQDPAEPKRVDVAVETESQPAAVDNEPSGNDTAPASQTTVETTVTQGSNEE